MLKIVEKTPGNIKDLRALFLRTRQKAFDWLNTKEYTLQDFDKETEGELVLVAMIDETVAGFVSLWPEDNFIHHLYVDQNYQDKNIGTELLQATIGRMCFPIRLKCLKRNDKAVNFYLRRGFVEKETGVSDEGEYIVFELPDQKK